LKNWISQQGALEPPLSHGARLLFLSFQNEVSDRLLDKIKSRLDPSGEVARVHWRGRSSAWITFVDARAPNIIASALQRELGHKDIWDYAVLKIGRDHYTKNGAICSMSVWLEKFALNAFATIGRARNLAAGKPGAAREKEVAVIVRPYRGPKTKARGRRH
jgi:hypothetical protein